MGHSIFGGLKELNDLKDFFNKKIIIRYIRTKQLEELRIGMVVEIDESKFVKRKYSRGRPVEGQWVFGGICLETSDSFLVALPGSSKSLLYVTFRHKRSFR